MPTPLFLIPILVGLITQILKRLLNKRWYAQLEAGGQKVPRYGGMPSAHTAFVVSLATVVAMTDGIYTTSFVIASALLILVIDDALRLRMFLSNHGEAIQMLVRKLPPEAQKDFPYIEARLGHKTIEAIVGALVGIGLTLILMYLFVQN